MRTQRLSVPLRWRYAPVTTGGSPFKLSLTRGEFGKITPLPAFVAKASACLLFHRILLRAVEATAQIVKLPLCLGETCVVHDTLALAAHPLPKGTTTSSTSFQTLKMRVLTWLLLRLGRRALMISRASVKARIPEELAGELLTDIATKELRLALSRMIQRRAHRSLNEVEIETHLVFSVRRHATLRHCSNLNPPTLFGSFIQHPLIERTCWQPRLATSDARRSLPIRPVTNPTVLLKRIQGVGDAHGKMDLTGWGSTMTL